MKATTIIESIKTALNGDYDREVAIKRLDGYIKRYTGKDLHIRNERGYYRLYIKEEGEVKYNKASSKDVHNLARKRYCKVLIKVLESEGKQREKYLVSLSNLLEKFEAAKLDLEQIVFTPKQYKWYKSSFVQKPSGDASHELNGILMRSKSEKLIAKKMTEAAVPFHYEERLKIHVGNMVEALRKQLIEGSFFNWEFKGKLYFEKEGRLIWLVPSEFQWMNSSGSLWKTYDPRTGYITIFPDFCIMLADGTMVFWEHEGIVLLFSYRCNAKERESVMKIAGQIEDENLIVTYEWDVEDEEQIRELINRVILPRLWW